MRNDPPDESTYHCVQREQRLVSKEGQCEKEIDIGCVERIESFARALDGRREPDRARG